MFGSFVVKCTDVTAIKITKDCFPCIVKLTAKTKLRCLTAVLIRQARRTQTGSWLACPPEDHLYKAHVSAMFCDQTWNMRERRKWSTYVHEMSNCSSSDNQVLCLSLAQVSISASVSAVSFVFTRQTHSYGFAILLSGSPRLKLRKRFHINLGPVYLHDRTITFGRKGGGVTAICRITRRDKQNIPMQFEPLIKQR
jgi:hypothetical protein